METRHTNESAVYAVLGGDVTSAEAVVTGSSDSEPFPALNNVGHQRRRVNPESLALRLGPDLVRDLNALITPGNTEMPSFAVRKELQERYNIDRRHIYDYFHSRGLRVVKEDKPGDPLAIKDQPTSLPNLRPLRQVPVKNSRSHPVTAERKLFKPRGVTKAKPGRPRKNPPVNPRILLVTCETTGPTDTNDPVSEHSPDAVPTPSYVSVNPLLPYISPPPMVEEDENYVFNSFVNPLDESFSVRRAIGDIAYAYRHKLVFERMQELVEHPLRPVLTGDQSLPWNETSPCFASDRGLLFPHARPLTRDDRHAIYETLSSSLGPAHGIQECQGTYKKHMQARTKLYFEGLLPVPYGNSEQPVKTSMSLDRKPSLATDEFRHWLSETKFLKRDGINGLPWLHNSHRSANVADQQETDGISDKRYPHRIQTLDEMFSTLGANSHGSDLITDSPVVHTREITRATAHAQGAVDGCNTSDHLLFSASSDPRLPILSGRVQFHGIPGFSGPQGGKTRMPVAETDGHSQWLEHVPHVVHSGWGAILGETPCKGRDTSNNTRNGLPSSSTRTYQVRDPDRMWTRPVTPRDARRRTPSAAGDI